jgi:hypothetical protein
LTWVNWDIDKKEPGDVASSAWYQAGEIFQVQVTKPPVINQTAHSSSYLQDLSLDSRNILISPPIKITNNKSTLSWKSCPLQGPVFMDGYKVLVTVTSNDISKAKPDTVFVAAEVTSYLDPPTLELSDYTFSNGYIHADGYTKKEYWDTTGVAIFYRGKLEPHSVSLAKYEGKTIYVHFVHDSGDDYILEIDDVLVKANETSNTHNPVAEKFNLFTYPNPVDNRLNVLYSLEKTSDVEINLVSINGSIEKKLFSQKSLNGQMNHDFSIQDTPAGSYLLQVKIGTEIAYKPLVKK